MLKTDMLSWQNERKTGIIVNFCLNIWWNEIKSVISQRQIKEKKAKEQNRILNHLKNKQSNEEVQL